MISVLKCPLLEVGITIAVITGPPLITYIDATLTVIFVASTGFNVASFVHICINLIQTCFVASDSIAVFVVPLSHRITLPTAT